MEYPYNTVYGKISHKQSDDNAYTNYSDNKNLRKPEFKYVWNGNKIEGMLDMEPELHFKQKQLDRINFWLQVLKRDHHEPLPCNDEKVFLAVNFDLHNQNVIRNDCERTRNKEFTENLKSELELFLTYYCKQQNIVYKQGLNEVAAPFIMFRQIKIPLFSCFNMFHLFVNRYLPNLFIDEDFLCLQSWFYLFSFLMRYHDPYMAHFLTIHYLSPELYATPWFLTLFASKTKTDILYLLWDLYMIEDDPTFVLFLALALINLNKAQLFSSDVGNLPQMLSNLTIGSVAELKKVFEKALEFKAKTPVSFFLKVKNLMLYKEDKSFQTMKKNILKLENTFCLTITPIEILKALYPNFITCINHDCPSNKNTLIKELLIKQIRKDNGENIELETEAGEELENFNIIKNQSNHEDTEDRDHFTTEDERFGCSFCTVQLLDNETQKIITKIDPVLKEFIIIWEGNKMGSFVSTLNFRPVDLRRNRNTGILPSSHLIPLKIEKQDITNLPINDMIEHKGVYHFCFIISEFDGNMPKMESPSKRKTSNDLPPNIEELSENERESILLKKFVKDFCENGFPYISILKGGFKLCHDYLTNLGYKIQDHNNEECTICNNGKKTGVGLIDYFASWFKSTPENKEKASKMATYSGSSKSGEQPSKTSGLARQNSDGVAKYSSPKKEINLNREIKSTELCSGVNEATSFNNGEPDDLNCIIGERNIKQSVNFKNQNGGLLNKIPTFKVNTTLSSEMMSKSSRSTSDYYVRTYPDSERVIKEDERLINRNFSYNQQPIKEIPNITVNSFSPNMNIERKADYGSRRKDEGQYPYKNSPVILGSQGLEIKYDQKIDESFKTAIKNHHGMYKDKKENPTQIREKDSNFLGVNEVYGFTKKEEPPKDKSKDGRYSLGFQKETSNKTEWTKINQVRDWEAYLEKNRSQLENKPVFSNLSLMKIGESSDKGNSAVYPLQHHTGQKLSMPMNSYYGPPSTEKGGVFENSSFFTRNGIMNEIKVSRVEWIQFLNYLRGNNFHIYRCNSIKEKISDDIRYFLTPKQARNVHHKISKRILIITSDFMMVIKYNTDLEQSLNHIKLNPAKDASSFNWSSHYGRAPPIFKENQANIPYGNITGDLLFPNDKSNINSNCVQIKSFFLMKGLIKITSKKIYPTILSFYFRLPNVSKTITLENNNYHSFLLNLEMPQILNFLISVTKNEFLRDFNKSTREEIKLEGRCVLDLLVEPQAKTCIDKSKELYLDGNIMTEQF